MSVLYGIVLWWRLRIGDFRLGVPVKFGQLTDLIRLYVSVWRVTPKWSNYNVQRAVLTCNLFRPFARVLPFFTEYVWSSSASRYFRM